MQTIEIDTDVFAYLQKNARPFVDTPNSTLRRLLGLDVSKAQPQKKSPVASDVDLDALLAESLAIAAVRSKAPKANLQLLTQTGVLRNNQKLYLIDYQGKRVQKVSASVLGADLIYNGQRYSMSNLARQLLGQAGFKSNSVRGPAHWITDDGKTVKDLWQQYLDSQSKK
ncbi:MAG: hypothetical protein H3C26_19430 [Rhodocyclaceae bacterium]|nr:hypothetical protein [Rhodocyclaceae bacterium]